MASMASSVGAPHTARRDPPAHSASASEHTCDSARRVALLAATCCFPPAVAVQSQIDEDVKTL
eukprot:9346443-Pyramimonas_sp.AAC.1